MRELDNKIALVTGATSGIGMAVARRLAEEGAHVIAIGRNKEGFEELNNLIDEFGGKVMHVQVDLLEFQKIYTLAKSVAIRFGRLDILVSNAAILGDLSPIVHTVPEEWDKVMATNLTVNYHVIRSFDPLLKVAEAPRAMFVTSGVTQGAHAYWGAYAVSKAGLEKMVETYAEENLKTKLRVNLVDPGAVRTRMRAKAFPGENPETLPLPEDITDVFVRLASKDLQETGKKFYAK